MFADDEVIHLGGLPASSRLRRSSISLDNGERVFRRVRNVAQMQQCDKCDRIRFLLLEVAVRPER